MHASFTPVGRTTSYPAIRCYLLAFLFVPTVWAAESPWDTVLPRVAFTNAPLSSVFRYIEAESAKLNPTGTGVRIYCTDEGWVDSCRVSLNLANWTNTTCRFVAETLAGTLLIIGDIGVQGGHYYRCGNRTVAIYGRCRDAETGEPIRDVRITGSGWEKVPKGQGTVSDTDGRFIAYVTHLVARPKFLGVGVMHDDREDKVVVHAEALGYQPRDLTVNVGDFTPPAWQEPLDIRLTKSHRNALDKLWMPLYRIRAHKGIVCVLLGGATLVLLMITMRQRRQIKLLQGPSR